MAKNKTIGSDLVKMLDDTSKTTVKALRRNVGGKKSKGKKTKKRLRRVERQLNELTLLVRQQYAANNSSK
ncbi:hypothetical protein [Streptomyces olivaceus]|uniref:hypothetical protein n=1 Tax=Streptomyces olivaceus TaxID=47716 RepID=UPI0036ECCBE5